MQFWPHSLVRRAFGEYKTVIVKMGMNMMALLNKKNKDINVIKEKFNYLVDIELMLLFASFYPLFTRSTMHCLIRFTQAPDVFICNS